MQLEIGLLTLPYRLNGYISGGQTPVRLQDVFKELIPFIEIAPGSGPINFVHFDCLPENNTVSSEPDESVNTSGRHG